jgi:phosphatidylinositol-3-phosphatase
LDSEELAVTAAFWRVGERLIRREAGPDHVIALHTDQRKGRCRRRDLARVHRLQALDRVEDDGELTGEPLDLLVGQRDAREIGDVNDRGAVDGHETSLEAVLGASRRRYRDVMGIWRQLATLPACAIFVSIVACGGGNNAPASTPYGQASPTAAPASAALDLPSDPQQRLVQVVTPHVFVIVMENTGLDRALHSQPIARLASANALATNYRAVARPSLPNYLALTSGSTWGIADNLYHPLPAADLGTQLTTAGITWRAYMEGMTAEAGCMRSPYPYALKHNPFAYYGGACPSNVVPIEALDADLAAETPSFVWITPDLCHDGHDCVVDVAGEWLDGLVSRIVSSDAWGSGGMLFIVWDEGDGGDNNVVPLIVLTKDASATRIETQYDHYSLLATIEDIFSVPRLGAAATARPLAPLIASPSR